MKILEENKSRNILKMTSERKKNIIDHINKIAPEREKWIKRNQYYYNDLKRFFRYHIPENKDVLEIGCGTGYLLNSICPSRGVGIDISGEIINEAKKKYPHLIFYQMDAENLTFNQKFDYIVISDAVGYFEDVQKTFSELKKVSTQDTRIIITYHNFLWEPIFKLAELLGLKMPQSFLNWLNSNDISNLLELNDFEVIKRGRRFLIPKFFPLISWFVNKYLANLPIINIFCITNYIIAKQQFHQPANNKLYSVSVIVPARNEKGNIEKVARTIPRMGKHTEIIFVEGHSADDTRNEIKNVCNKYSRTLDIKYTIQDGKGKGDAVRKGFMMAKGDILMILDADLTAPPEDLQKFYDAMAMGKGEYINGSRLVYPMEKEAMRILNLIGNKFFSLMFTWLLGQKLKDTLCGTKVIARKNYEKLAANRKYFGDFDPFGDFDLIFGAAKLNLKIVEIPIRYKAREYGNTNISRFEHGWLLLKMVFFAMNKIKFV